MKAVGSPDNCSPVRIGGNLLLNAVLLPLYFLLFLLCVFIAISPLFPARTARENFRARLGLKPALRIMATAATLFHYILLLIEDFIFWPLGLVTIRDNAAARESVTKASLIAQQKNVALTVLSAHFGNIEITAQCLNSLLVSQVNRKQRLIALAKPSRWEWITNLLEWYRNLRGIEVLQTNRKDLPRAMLQALKSGRALALLVDQKPASAGFFIDFFGAQSAFPGGGVDVCARMKSEFVFVTSRRLWPGFYTFEGRHFTAHADNDLNSALILTSYARWLEAVIRISPWQWSWDYRKWSRKPAGGAQA
ncbi:MAG: hypothetical protein RLZZ488_1727 [Pseudomonadota bacterium]